MTIPKHIQEWIEAEALKACLQKSKFDDGDVRNPYGEKKFTAGAEALWQHLLSTRGEEFDEKAAWKICNEAANGFAPVTFESFGVEAARWQFEQLAPQLAARYAEYKDARYAYNEKKKECGELRAERDSLVELRDDIYALTQCGDKTDMTEAVQDLIEAQTRAALAKVTK